MTATTDALRDHASALPDMTADEMPDVRLYAFAHRGGTYYSVKTRYKGREIETTISPTGRSIRVHVDGEKWEVTP